MPGTVHQLVRTLPAALAPFVLQLTYQLVDLSERTDAEIRDEVLTRLVQLTLRWIYSDQPIEQVRDRQTARFRC